MAWSMEFKGENKMMSGDTKGILSPWKNIGKEVTEGLIPCEDKGRALLGDLIINLPKG